MPGSRPRPRSSFEEDAARDLGLAAVLACVLVWASSQLAALAVSHQPLRLGLVEVLWSVYGWARNWRDPALGFPAEARVLLPGPVGMYASLSVVALGPLALVHGVRFRLRRPRSERSRSSRPNEWASRFQVRGLAVRRAAGLTVDVRAAIAGWLQRQPVAVTRPAVTAVVVAPLLATALMLPVVERVDAALELLHTSLAARAGLLLGLVGLVGLLMVRKGSPTARVILGRRWQGCSRPLLAAEGCASVICFGPPGYFKTAGLAIPAILEWAGAVVATSIKPDVVRATLAWRAALGQVWVYNPLHAAGLPANTWTPLASCRSWAGAREMGRWLADAADVSGMSRDESRYWALLGGKLLAVLLFVAANTGRAMADVVRWIDTQERDQLDDALAELGDRAAEDAWSACKAREERTLSSVYGTAETLLDVYGDPRVVEAAEGCEIDIDLLLSGSHTLYLYAPEAQQDRLRPLFHALLSAVVRRAQELAAERPDGLLDPRLLLCLDEAGNIAALKQLPSLATTGRGQGIALLSIFHDYGQLRHRYGHLADTVVNGHRAKLFLSGQADLGSLELAARLLGDEQAVESSVSLPTWPPLELDGSRTTVERPRPLLPAAQVRQLRKRHAILVYGHLPAVKVRLRAWWRSPALRLRARGGWSR